MIIRKPQHPEAMAAPATSALRFRASFSTETRRSVDLKALYASLIRTAAYVVNADDVASFLGRKLPSKFFCAANSSYPTSGTATCCACATNRGQVSSLVVSSDYVRTAS